MPADTPGRNIRLTSRGILRIGGEERVAFLQGLITQNAENIATGELCYALLLTPQGKLLHDFFLLNAGDVSLIECEKNRRQDLLTRLTRYRLRAKVTLEDVTEQYAVVVSLGDGSANKDAHPDPRHAALGSRAILPHEKAQTYLTAEGLTHGSEEAYTGFLLEHGIPNGSRDMQPEQTLPMEFGLDKLHAIDFTKGCFVGQEVTARTKHRATLRKGLYQITAESGALPAYGTELRTETGKAGMMLSSRGNIGLALLRHEEAASLTHIDNMPIETCAPDWF